MSRIRSNQITNQSADGAPTVQHGLIISGVTTAVTVDVNGDLDVDGHTNLDNVSISGISSTGNIYITTGGNGRKLSFAGDGSSHYIKMDNTLNGPIINGYGGIAFETNGTNERLRIDSSGRLLVGAASIATPKSSGSGSIDLDNQAFTIMVGGNHPSGGRSDNTAKTFRMSMVHNTLAEEPINILQGYCDSSDNNLYIGGGTGSANSVTQVRIYTGANTTTTGGTERIRVNNSGAIGLSGANYGSSGQVLTSQGSGSAVQWATPSGGKVLQTINATASSQVERTSSGFADTGLTANITLSAANKVLIFVAQALEARQYNATGFAVGRLKLVRITSGTYYNIFGPGGRSIVTSGPGSGSYFIASGCIASIVAEDSPGVGTHTYATQIARTVGGGGTAIRANSDGHPAEIILMEVEA